MEISNLEYVPEVYSGDSTCVYSLSSGRVGINGFFLSFSDLEHPVFHQGSFDSYKFLSLSNSGIFIHASPNDGVYIIDLASNELAIWQAWFCEIYITNIALVFSGDGHPVEGSTPDQLKFLFETGKACAASANIHGKSSFKELEFTPLDEKLTRF